MSEHPLEHLFHPRSVAVVGASTSQGPGGGFVTAIQEMGYQGALYPVNPKAEEIQGLKCYPSLLDVPGEVDYVISSVPARIVPQLVEDSAAKGAKAVHFFTAGFSETGEADRAGMEAHLLARARELGLRLIGPNCMGLYCPESGLSFMPGMPKEPGPVGMVSQSGANAGEFCRTGGVRGLRISKAISYGNALDLNESDFLEYLGQDTKTEIIVGYIEGVKDGQRFLRALRAAATAKPVIILKGGQTEAGARATASADSTLWPPPMPTMPTRGPSRRSTKRKATAQSTSSSMLSTRSAPAWRQAASKTWRAPARLPVCDIVARPPASVRPPLRTTTGFAAAAVRNAARNRRPSRTPSTYAAMTDVLGSAARYSRKSLSSRSAALP